MKEPKAIVLKYEAENSKTQDAQKTSADGGHAATRDEYEAVDVACGPYCTFVVGRLQPKDEIEVEEHECKEILKGLKKELLEKGTLA